MLLLHEVAAAREGLDLDTWDEPLDAGHRVARALRELPEAPTREALDRAARQQVALVLDVARAREQAYDQETQYGATQGARFP